MWLLPPERSPCSVQIIPASREAKRHYSGTIIPQV